METARCKAFLAAAEGGTLTAAADELGYTPSGVSQLITALEEDLGFKLLDRTRKGVRLSRAGERMLPMIRQFIKNEEDLYEMARNINGLTTGTVTIASYVSVATFLMPDVIRAFQKDYPMIEIRLMEGNWTQICENLRKGIADAAILTYDEFEDLDCMPLREDEMVAVLPQDHPLAGSDVYPLSRCEEEDFIVPGLGNDIDVINLLKKHDLHPHVKYVTNDTMVMLSMIKSGLGMSLINRSATGKWTKDVAILPLDPSDTMTYGLAVQKGRSLSPAVEKFNEYVVRMLTKESTR